MAADTECFIWNVNPAGSNSGPVLKSTLPPECPLASNFCWRVCHGVCFTDADILACLEDPEGNNPISITSISGLPIGVVHTPGTGVDGRVGKANATGVSSVTITAEDSLGNSSNFVWNGMILPKEESGENSNFNSYWGSAILRDKSLLFGGGGAGECWVPNTGTPTLEPNSGVTFAAGERVSTRWDDNQVWGPCQHIGTEVGANAGKERWSFTYDWNGGAEPVMSGFYPGFNVITPNISLGGNRRQIIFENDIPDGSWDYSIRMEAVSAGTMENIHLVPMADAPQFEQYQYGSLADFFAIPNILSEEYLQFQTTMGFGILRWLHFSDINNTNNQIFWADRNEISNNNWGNRPGQTGKFGAPWEAICKMCNEVGANPWVQTPSWVFQDPNTTSPGGYVYEQAMVFKTWLDKSLEVRPCYSNETWNYPLNNQAALQLGPLTGTDYKTMLQNTAILHKDVHDTWQQVFGDEACRVYRTVENRLAGSTWDNAQALETDLWTDQVGNYTDSIAINPYVGYNMIDNEFAAINAIVADWKAGNVAQAYEDYWQIILNGSHLNLTTVISQMQALDAYITANWPHILIDWYEGGSHFNSVDFQVGTHGTATQQQDFVAFNEEWIKQAPQSRLFVETLLDAWKALDNSGAYVWFQHGREWEDNSYGTIEFYCEPNFERTAALRDWNNAEIQHCP